MTLSISMNIRRCLFVAATGWLALWMTAAAADDEPLWREEFESGDRPDPGTWSYDLGASGWGNQELQNYTDAPANVRVEDGDLVITARREVSASGVPEFTSARIRTQDKLLIRYGTIEARIRVPDLDAGLWPAFWTLGGDFATVGWPACGELDVLEMGQADVIAAGTVNRTVYSTAHWEHEGAYAGYGLKLDTGQDLDGDYHRFTMDWTPESVTTFVDGRKIWTFDISPANCADCTEFHKPHFLLVNMAVGGAFTGRLQAADITATMPAELRVDYIRIFDNGHTELSGSAVEESPPR